MRMLTPPTLPLRLLLTSLMAAVLSACGGAPITSSSAVTASSDSAAMSSSSLALSRSSVLSSSSILSISSISSSIPSSSSIASSASAPSQLVIDARSANLCAHAGADEITHMGYQGEGYYNGSNMAGAGFSLAVKAENAGDYSLTLQYANGGSLTRNTQIQSEPGLRGKKLSLAPTNGWDQWQSASINVSLKEGTNMIAFTAMENDGLANIDTITLDGTGLSRVQCPQPKPVTVPFIVGMDISSIPELRDFNVEFYDLDGQRKNMLALLKSHGVNFIRLRTFVSPSAPAGYASMDATCPGKSEAYNDQAHLVAFAKEIKQAGFGLLLNVQYSDTWTDPGKQIIPQAWRSITSLSAMATQVRNYTRDLVSLLDTAGAKPEIVQIGNEITAGLLVHLPTSATTCWGDHPTLNNINGSAENWDNLATLLKAGIEGVKAVDNSIKIMLHIENTGSLSGMQWWVDNALMRNVSFDILGLSAYEPYQGPSSSWQSALTAMATRYPQLQFNFVEYNQEITLINNIMRQLPNGQGTGAFFWEPTQSGHWGESLFEWSGNSTSVKTDRFGEFDSVIQSLNLQPTRP